MCEERIDAVIDKEHGLMLTGWIWIEKVKR